MSGINKVILIGNLGKDPETRNFDNGSVTRFSLATNENYRDKNGEWQTRTEWHNVVCWRNLAERAEKNLKKGMQIYIEGKLRTRSYTDKDGNQKYTTEVEAEYFTMLGSRNAEGGSNSSSATQQPSNEASFVADESGGDDLPF